MDHDAELKRIQEMAINHAIEEMNASDERGIESREERGDRGFLTGMAARSLGVAVKIEQFLALRREHAARGQPLDDEADEERAKAKLIKQARAEVQGVLARVRKPRADA